MPSAGFSEVFLLLFFYYFFFSTWLILNRVGSMYGREGTNNRSPRDLFRPTKAKHYTRTAVRPSPVQPFARNMHLGLYKCVVLM
jgi:hypothetical protein